MLHWNKKILLVASVFLIFIFAVTINAAQFTIKEDADPSKYPPVVAKVGDKNITNKDLGNAVSFEKFKFRHSSQIPTDTELESYALRTLIIDTALYNEAIKRKIVVQPVEAKKYLMDIYDEVKNMNDSDPNKVAFMDGITASGFTDPEVYIKDPSVIEATQRMLARSKLVSQLFQEAPGPTQAEINNYLAQNNLTGENQQAEIQNFSAKIKNDQVWNQKVKELVDKSNYQLVVPIDVKF